MFGSSDTGTADGVVSTISTEKKTFLHLVLMQGTYLPKNFLFYRQSLETKDLDEIIECLVLVNVMQSALPLLIGT